MNLYQRSAQATLAYYEKNELPQYATSTLIQQTLPVLPTDPQKTRVIVEAENVVNSIFQHVDGQTGVMNFASPFYPGGNFLRGVNAQEETLARCSFLYPELVKFQATYYEKNQRKPQQDLYSDDVIYSKAVWFVKREVAGKETFVTEPYLVDVATVAAPNQRAMRLHKNQLAAAVIERHLRYRILQTLRAFKQAGCQTIILGAFGCGVFGNDPKVVARLFAESLAQADLVDAFKTIVFSLYQKDANYFAFAQQFARS